MSAALIAAMRQGSLVHFAAPEMHDEPTYWFPAKRHGWGWGWPTQWQGWAVMVAFGLALLVGAIALLPGYGRAAFVAYAALLCLLLVAVCWIKGEPPGAHWRGK